MTIQTLSYPIDITNSNNAMFIKLIFDLSILTLGIFIKHRHNVHGLLPVYRNHHGRRGTTADIGDNLLSSLTVFGCSLTAVEV